MYVTCTHVKMGLHLCACVETRDWHQVSSSITILFSGTFPLDWLGNHLEFSYLYFAALRLQEGITGPGLLVFSMGIRSSCLGNNSLSHRSSLVNIFFSCRKPTIGLFLIDRCLQNQIDKHILTNLISSSCVSVFLKSQLGKLTWAQYTGL